MWVECYWVGFVFLRQRTWARVYGGMPYRGSSWAGFGCNQSVLQRWGAIHVRTNLKAGMSLRFELCLATSRFRWYRSYEVFVHTLFTSYHTGDSSSLEWFDVVTTK